MIRFVLCVSSSGGGVGGEEDEEETANATGEETHVCDKCCAEFFTWAELSRHRSVCTEDDDPLVLIVRDDDAEGDGEGEGEGEEPLVGRSPAPSAASSGDSSAACEDVIMDGGGGFELGENDGLDRLEDARDDGLMELQDKYATAGASPPPPDSAEATPPQQQQAAALALHPSGCYELPSTNVTLEILHSTRVAVAQFSQGVGVGGRTAGGKMAAAASAAAIPVILEHLLALQQQQVHQLQLIEQICSQVAVMNRRPPPPPSQAVAAAAPASRSLSLAPMNPFPTQSAAIAAAPPPVLPLSGTMPSAVNGHAAVSQKTQNVSSGYRDVSCTSELSAPPPLSGGGGGVSTLLPPYTGSHSSSSQSGLLSSPFLPRISPSPPNNSGVIFPNPLASIAATANALDPLAALMKHRKGKGNGVVSHLFEPAPAAVSAAAKPPGADEPFFKHKCRFCAKVFGSDSALQIHLRSHTGERPFKCNICGNRFSTKGNLKVHFQRHKEKYPHVQMNPYPVPEYLDNVPTSSGIPYGMSVPPEKPVSSWLDGKPVVAAAAAATIATVALPLSSTVSGVGGSNDAVSVTPSVKSPFPPAPAECVSLSPSHRGGEARFSPVSESNRETEAANVLRAEAQSCGLRLRANAASPEPSAAAAPDSPPPPLPPPPLLDETKFPACVLLESMQTSETSKLQQLVENIDKKITVKSFKRSLPVTDFSFYSVR